MMKFGLRYVWFKLALAVGSVLGVLLLAQSLRTYYQVSRILVIQELRREADRQVTALVREASQSGFQDPSELGPMLEELRRDAPNKIAWIRVTGTADRVLAQAGNPMGPPVARPRPGPDGRGQPPDIRETARGRVFVSAVPWRPLERGRHMPETRPRPGASQRPRRVEIALYLDSVSATFAPLLTSLIVNCSAALGLVASMVLLWIRFPNYLRGKQLEQQTELARQVQMDLLPPGDLTFKDLDFAAECVPAWQVGGDFYDVFHTGGRRLAMILGDVSGKGLPASVVVGLLLGAIRASSWIGGRSEHEQSSQRLSELLRTRTSLERFASLFWCYYEPETQVLRYVNAGHLPPMVVRQDGAGQIQVQRLEEGGPVLGVIPQAGYRQGELAVCPGDLLVMYSDGVVEATNAADEQFGEDRLRAVIGENARKPSGEIRDHILKAVHTFLGEQTAQDDLTLAVARFLEQ